MEQELVNPHLNEPTNMVGTPAELEKLCTKAIYMAQLQAQLEVN